MDHLSACYFCGIALDEPLADYPVVPAQHRREDARHTVTLCPACHQKLDGVVDIVVDAVEGSDERAHAAASGDETKPHGDTGDDSDTVEPTTDAADTGEIRFDAENGDGTDEGTPADGDGPEESRADEDPDGHSVENLPDHGAGVTGGRADSEDGDGGETDPLASAMEADLPDELQTAGEESGVTDDETDGAPDEGANGGASGSGSAGTGGDSEDDGDDGGTAPDARATISALEYNKVMRLLQNREFPVDRDEIETVAASAYGMARTDCADVIDLAIDRELIGETDGQLVRPD